MWVVRGCCDGAVHGPQLTTNTAHPPLSSVWTTPARQCSSWSKEVVTFVVASHNSGSTGVVVVVVVVIACSGGVMER